MAEIKGYIYDEIKYLAIGKKHKAQQRVDEKYEKELEKVKQKAEKEITPEVLKAANIKVSFENYGDLKLDVRIPKDKEKSFEEKYKKLRSELLKKSGNENQEMIGWDPTEYLFEHNLITYIMTLIRNRSWWRLWITLQN